MDKKNFTKTGDIDGRSRLGRTEGIRYYNFTLFSSIQPLPQLLGVLTIIWLDVFTTSIGISHTGIILMFTIGFGIFVGFRTALIIALNLYGITAVVLGLSIIIGWIMVM